MAEWEPLAWDGVEPITEVEMGKGTLAQRVRERRVLQGLTQTRLAKSISELRGMRVSQQAINDIESGAVRSPRYLVELAQALQTTPAALLGKITDHITATDTVLEAQIPLFICLPVSKGPKHFPKDVFKLDSQLLTLRPNRLPARDAWMAELRGKSPMSPVYNPGDLLLLDPSKDVREGDDCFFMSAHKPERGVAAKLAKLLKARPKNWLVQSSYLPRKEETLSRKRFPRAVVVVGSYNAGHGRMP